MKIGILTFHNTLNYGAALQAFALETKIKELGAKCEIINYHCKNIELREHFVFPKYENDLITYLKNIKGYMLSTKKRRKIKKFIKENMIISNNEYNRNTINSSNKIYDKFIVGSDMVFDTSKGNGDLSFYLDFADSNKRYSYAACLGKDEIDEKYLNECKINLEKFRYISVREDRTKEYFSKILNNKNICVNIDPTLLYDSSFWEKYEEKPKKFSKNKYILLYFVGKDSEELKMARKIAKENNLNIYILSNSNFKVDGCKVISDASVGEFLYYIHNAELVITASFHGLIFSMNYNINFMYFNKYNSVTKLESMAIFTNSTDRKITNNYIPNIECNFENINKILNNSREKSIEYLKKLIND